MLEAAEWFVTNELANVREVCDRHPGYGLVLVGHSLGAGTACLLAHWIRNDPGARCGGALLRVRVRVQVSEGGGAGVSGVRGVRNARGTSRHLCHPCTRALAAR